jgi:altronate dehydratase
MPKLAIRIDTQDNVAMAMETLTVGETLSVLSDEAQEVDRVAVTTDVPLAYHKVALTGIDRGDPILKYGEVIGYATVPIERGEWVHLHNVESVNYRTRRSAGSETDG